MVPSTRLWVGICGLLALGGCAEATVPRACQLVDPAPAVRVEVQDSVTLAWVASGATLVLQDGAFVDSVSVPASRTDLNAVPLFTSRVYGRPGTYVVTVRRSGYANWVKASVIVRRVAACEVPGVRLVARLVPVS